MFNIITCTKYQYLQFFITLLFGSFGILSFSPYNFWPAGIISCTNLLIHINIRYQWKQVILYSIFWSIGFFGCGLYWIYITISEYSNLPYYINVLLFIFLILYLTLFPVLFSIILLYMVRSCSYTWSIVIFAPILWSIIEYIRGHIFTGFPWLQLGYNQIDGPLKGIAPIFGVEGITFIIISISALIAYSIKTKQILPFFISISIVFLLWPLKFIKWYNLKSQDTIHISLVQGNINQHEKWDSNYIATIIQIYLQHTIPILGKTQIIIWPESAIPGNEIDYKNFLILLDSQLRKYKTSLITGIISTYDNPIDKNRCYYYNSIIVIGDVIPYKYTNYNRYNKHHLVLFSEKIPLSIFCESLFKIFNLPFSYIKAGHYIQSQLHISDIKITPAICYEMIFGNQIRDNFKFNTDFLLVIANNAWFGNSTGPWQFFQMVRMRALELGRPVLCSTNNGITAIINADGSIHTQIPQFISTVLDATIIPTTGKTFYATKFGSRIFWCYNIIICVLLFILHIIQKIINRKIYFKIL